MEDKRSDTGKEQCHGYVKSRKQGYEDCGAKHREQMLYAEDYHAVGT